MSIRRTLAQVSRARRSQHSLTFKRPITASSTSSSYPSSPPPLTPPSPLPSQRQFYSQRGPGEYTFLAFVTLMSMFAGSEVAHVILQPDVNLSAQIEYARAKKKALDEAQKASTGTEATA